MLTHPEAKRQTTLMLEAALCNSMKPDETSRQVYLVCDRHDRECLEEPIGEILIEAGRIGPKHSDGQLRPRWV